MSPCVLLASAGLLLRRLASTFALWPLSPTNLDLRLPQEHRIANSFCGHFAGTDSPA